MPYKSFQPKKEKKMSKKSIFFVVVFLLIVEIEMLIKSCPSRGPRKKFPLALPRLGVREKGALLRFAHAQSS